MSTLAALDFSGRRVLVTGGAAGIGKAIAIKFAELHATVIVLDNNEPLLSELKKEYPAIETVVVDLTDWDAARSVVKSLLPIHHLANNAGILREKLFLDVDVDHIDSIFAINFKGALNVAQVVAQGMIDHGIKNGTIVNNSSIGDSVVSKGVAIYCALKAGLSMLSKTMAVELAPHGIRVNYVRPAAVNTEIMQNLPQENKDRICGPVLERMLDHEFIETEEIANAFVYLSSPLSKSVAGVGLAIDQGYSIQ